MAQGLGVTFELYRNPPAGYTFNGLKMGQQLGLCGFSLAVPFLHQYFMERRAKGDAVTHFSGVLLQQAVISFHYMNQPLIRKSMFMGFPMIMDVAKQYSDIDEKMTTAVNGIAGMISGYPVIFVSVCSALPTFYIDIMLIKPMPTML